MAYKPPQPDGQMDPQHVEFCHHLQKHWNGGRAAIEAKYSEKNARAQATKLLKREDVQELLLKLGRARLRKIDLEANDVLAGLGRIATYDVAELFDDEDNLLQLRQVPEELRRCLKSIKFNRVKVETIKRNKETDEEVISETTTTQVIEVKMPDRLKAYELIGRHLELFKNDDFIPLETPPGTVGNKELARRLAFVIAGAVNRGESVIAVVRDEKTINGDSEIIPQTMPLPEDRAGADEEEP